MALQDAMCQKCNCILHADALLVFILLEADQTRKLIIARIILTLKSPVPWLLNTELIFFPCVINTAIFVS